MELETKETVKEVVANAMLQTKGNLTLASRLPEVGMNAMALRNFVAQNKEVRIRYHELLAATLEESGLLLAERILEMSIMQQNAYGDLSNDIPPDPKMAIELSKEISRLLAEGKQGNVSSSTAMIITSKEGASEILQRFLDS